MPITYMTLIEGQAQARWGSGGMLVTEAVLGVAGVVSLWRHRSRDAPPRCGRRRVI